MFIIMYLCSSDKVVKNVTRREEITLLKQGLVLPTPRPCSSSNLLSVMEQYSSPPPPAEEPYEFHEPILRHVIKPGMKAGD